MIQAEQNPPATRPRSAPTLIITPLVIEHRFHTEYCEERAWLGVPGKERLGLISRGDVPTISEAILHRLADFDVPPETRVIYQMPFGTSTDTIGNIRHRSREVLDERARANDLMIYGKAGAARRERERRRPPQTVRKPRPAPEGQSREK